MGKNHHSGLLTAGLLFFTCSFTQAESSLSFSLNYADQDYSEYNQSGDFLDSDSGGLIGAGISYSWQKNNWLLSTEFQRVRNNIDYHSILTDSQVDTRIDEFSLGAGHQFIISESLKTRLLAGLARRDWERNIATALPYFGLHEDYQYDYYFLETSGEYQLSDTQSIYFAYRYKKSFDASIDVSFLSGDFDDTEVPLKDSSGDLIKFRWNQRLNDKWSLGLETSLDTWDFPRSDSVILTRDGSSTSSSVAEPKSDSRIISGKIIVTRSL